MSTPQPNREMVFCHQCENEWYRDEHGLTCPDCHSEFTEIIEPDHDPRDDHLALDDDDDFEEEHNPFHHHNPWNIPDPEEGVPDPAQGGLPPGLRLQRNGPNSYSITGTWSASFGGPRGQNPTHATFGDPNAFVNPLFRNFATMMQGIAGGTQRTPRDEQQQGQGEEQPGSSTRGETRSGSGPRYTYTSTARLFPRDANNPGPHIEPTDSLHDHNDTVDGLSAFQVRASQGQTDHHNVTTHPSIGLPVTGEMHQHNPLRAAVLELIDWYDIALMERRVIAGILGGGAFGPPPFARDHDHGPGSPRGDEGGIPPNPLAALFASLLNPQLAAHGDAVYSQEALDRVISQLMEQNATGNAPGPASAEAIASLPKKRVTRQMVGAEDSPPDFPDEELHGECSICMEEVPIGEEVTELPCGHWFHGQCIEAWLREHDTCPHCRKGIEKKDSKEGQQGGHGSSGGAADSSAPGSGSGSGSGAGSSSNNTPGNNGGSGSSNQPDDTFVPNMPGGLYATYYRVNTPRSQTRSPLDFPLFGFPHTMTVPPMLSPNHEPLDRPPVRHHRYSHRSNEPFMRMYDDPFEYYHHSSRGGNTTHTHVIVRQRRRSSLGRLVSNVGHSVSVVAGGGGGGGGGGGSATHGGDRPGIGERLRSLFRS